jgi:putative thioredoxin
MVKEVSDSDFDSRVIKSSLHTPVLLVCWAPWSQDCQSLNSLFEALEKQYRGKFLVAKLNVDANQKKSDQFGIRGIPAVKMFRDGKVAAEFVGFLPELSIRKWLDDHL